MIPGSQFLPRSLRKTHTQHHGGFCGGKTSENLFSSENIITIIIVVVVIVAHTYSGGTIRGCGPCTGVQSLRRRVLRAVVLTPTEKPTPNPLLDELNEEPKCIQQAVMLDAAHSFSGILRFGVVRSGELGCWTRKRVRGGLGLAGELQGIPFFGVVFLDHAV